MQITSKGQVTIPKKFRDKLGLYPGVELEFILQDNGLKLIKTLKNKNPFDKVYGILKSDGRSVDEIMEELRGR